MIAHLKCPQCNKVLFFRAEYDQRRVYGCPNCGAEVVLQQLAEPEVYLK